MRHLYRTLLLSLAVIAVSAIVTLVLLVRSQDVQIFPGLIAGLEQTKGIPLGTVPPDVESHFVTTSDGEKLEVRLMQAASEQQRAPSATQGIIILFHGNGETVRSGYHLQQWFRKLGYASVVFDYRGYGASSGWPSESGLYRDAEAVFEFVAARFPRESTRYVYYGSSIGSGMAAYLAQLHEPDLLLLMSPYSSIPDVLRTGGFVRWLIPFLRYEIPTFRYVQQLKHTRVAFFHGYEDTIIPIEHSSSMYEAFKGNVRFSAHFFEQASHNDLFAFAQSDLSQILSDLLA